MTANDLKLLPPELNPDQSQILKQLIHSHKALAELKGFSETIPNKNILINSVTINEAKDSSEIENIITTHAELFKAISKDNYKNPNAKEVVNYRRALWRGFELIREKQLLTTNMIIEIQNTIENNKAGIRRVPGTVIKNPQTGEVIYTPPESESKIRELLNNLENYINDDRDGVDPLVKMAVIHYQFESIHPFYDGNGRTGRIINILYLVLKDILDSPILYLSKYILENKNRYYTLFKEVRENKSWDQWIIYFLKALAETARTSLNILKEINLLIEETALEMQQKVPKIYSRELLELLFIEFYTKISYIQEGLGVTRKTASNYLSTLENKGFLSSEKLGREKIYKNIRLFELIKKMNQK
ncbi:Fic family protein [Halanaerobium sp. ST460_2HS_T2]|nr:Fic/DOC family N-terminal domain-containing protein [Halanaerobium sp. ST460_2HS_T2]RCW60335.1 Fic family protein [Halanaerobium sp. ST460_2HS_T2]